MTGIEWFFAVVVVMISVIVLITNFYILVYFSHPEDSFTQGIWLYRTLVVDLCSNIDRSIEFCILLDLCNSIGYSLREESRLYAAAL